MSGGLVMLLLFMQLATPAYACPAELQALRSTTTSQAMPDCDGNMPLDMDAEQPQLCKAHCDQGEQVVGPSSIMNAIGAHDYGRALRILARNLENGRLRSGFSVP